jgi:hypothetical protein
MTVTVNKMPGGVTQLFNTETGRVTYKCKAESAFLPIDAFGGIVKFNQKGAMAVVIGDVKSLDSCSVIKEGDPDYKQALIEVISSNKEFAKNKYESALKEIEPLETKLKTL